MDIQRGRGARWEIGTVHIEHLTDGSLNVLLHHGRHQGPKGAARHELFLEREEAVRLAQQLVAALARR